MISKQTRSIPRNTRPLPSQRDVKVKACVGNVQFLYDDLSNKQKFDICGYLVDCLSFDPATHTAVILSPKLVLARIFANQPIVEGADYVFIDKNRYPVPLNHNVLVTFNDDSIVFELDDNPYISTIIEHPSLELRVWFMRNCMGNLWNWDTETYNDYVGTTDKKIARRVIFASYRKKAQASE